MSGTIARCLSVILLASLSTSTIAAESAEQLIDRLETSYRGVATLHVEAVATKNSIAPKGVFETRTELWRQRKDGTCRSRLEVEQARLGEDGESRRVIRRRLEVDRGDFLWIERPGRDGVRVLKERTTCADPFYTEIRQKLAEEQARIEPSEEIDGKSATVVRFQRGLTILPIVSTYWIDEKTGVVLRKTVEAPAGKEEVTLAALEINTPVDETRFAYAPPDGAKVNDVATIEQTLDRVVRARRTFDSIYFETSARRVGDDQAPERVTREWLVQVGRTLKYRREARFVDPSDRASGRGDTITVSDGRHRWNESRLGADIQVSKMPATGADPELVLLRGQIRGTDAGPLGPQEIDGHRCSGVEIRHSSSTARHWFSEQYGILWKGEFISSSGRQETTTVQTVTRVQTDRPIGPDTFTYTVPDGVVVHDSEEEDAKIRALLESEGPIDTGPWRSERVSKVPGTAGVAATGFFSFTLSPDDRWLVFYTSEKGAYPPRKLVALDLRSGKRHEFDVAESGIETIALNEYCWTANGRYCLGDVRKPGERHAPKYPSFILDMGSSPPTLGNQFAGKRADGKEPETFASFGDQQFGCSDCYDPGYARIGAQLPDSYPSYMNSNSPGVALARNGKKIYCQKKLGTAVGLYEFDLMTRTDRRITSVSREFRGAQTISEIRESPDQRFIAFHSEQELYVADLERGKTYRVAQGVYHRVHWTSDSGQLYFYSCQRPGGCGGEHNHLYRVAIEELRNDPTSRQLVGARAR